MHIRLLNNFLDVMSLYQIHPNILRNLICYIKNSMGIYHHRPESKKRKSSEANSGSIHPYGRYGHAVKTTKTISTIAILWPVEAIFEKRAATVAVDSFVFLVLGDSQMLSL